MSNEITKKLKYFQKYYLKSIYRFLSQDGKYMQRKRYYEVLGLTPKATQTQIKSAYYKLSMMYHPDKNSSQAATIRFQEINEAYEVLGNYDLRKKYDRGILRERKLSDIHPSDEIKQEHEDFYKSREIRSRKPVLRGRSQIYNFDEFYRMHYKGAVYRDHIQQQDFKQHMANKDIGRRNFHLLLYLISAFFLVSLCFEYDKYLLDKTIDKKKDDKKTT